MTARKLHGRPVVVAGGCRTPFLRSGTGFADLMAYELAAMAISGLLDRTGVDPGAIDRIILGTVIAEPKTSNLAREAALSTALPPSCPAVTVTAACASSNVAIASAVEAIMGGAADLVIAGGAETLSDVPIRFSREVRKRLVASQKARSVMDWLKLLQGLSLGDLKPDAPALAEFSTGLSMGENAERLAKRLGIGRKEQDTFSLGSHQKAARAARSGLFDDQLVPVRVAPSFEPITSDNGVRGDSSLERLEKLAPAFDKRFGSVTAGNSSFLTDGAAVCLLASEKRATELGLTPLARVASLSLVGLDPVEELLLGPVVSVPEALDGAGITLEDVGIFEVHEAFAVPVLALVKLLADEAYCRQRLGREGAVGKIEKAKLNGWGGSLSLGHPFGATGARLVMTCCRRMEREGARWGVVTTCAAGALGHAMVLER